MDTNTILLQTKLHRPHVSNDLIIRPRLLERLDEEIDRPLTLVCAPAGFGKTTLVSSWIDRISSSDKQVSVNLPVAWLSLDKDDSDIYQFVQYLIAALRTIFNHACAESLKLNWGPQRTPPEFLYTTLINDIELLPKSFVLVLDDYHTIQGEDIPNLLNGFLEHWPHPLHLVLISRITPPLSLSRLRANGELIEIRSNDLRFDNAETATFLSRTLKMWLSESTVEQLNEKTAGWIGALRLATLSFRSGGNIHERIRTFAGSEVNIADYLVDEVLVQQFPAIQKFLLKTSILDQFCAPLCEAVIGEGDPAWGVRACIDWLERAELFIISLDNRKEWYRYHPLFRELLQFRLDAETRRDRINDLQCRASAWFERQGMVDEALKHALLAKNLDLAARLMEGALCEVINREDRLTLERWLRLLPEDFIQSRPGLLMIKAWALQFSWQLEAQANVIRQVEALFNLYIDDDTPTLASDRQALLGQIYLLKAQQAYFSNQPDHALAYCQEALELLPESWAYAHGGVIHYIALSMRASGESRAAERTLLNHYESLSDKTDARAPRLLLALCLIYLHNGDLDQVYQTARAMLSQADLLGRVIAKGWAHYFLGVVLYQWNDLEAAGGHFAELVDHRYTTQVLTARGGITGRALIQQIKSESVEAWRMVDLLSQMDLERTGAEEDRTRSLRARLSLLDGDLESAFRWADAFTNPPSDEPLTWLETPHLTLVRILLARKQPADLLRALQLLEVLNDIAERTYNTRSRIEILALWALTLDAQGDRYAAQEALQQAIDLARPGGFVRVFVDLGSPMRELLVTLDQNGQSFETVQRLLAAFPDHEITHEAKGLPSQFIRRSPRQNPDLVEPLTPPRASGSGEFARTDEY